MKAMKVCPRNAFLPEAHRNPEEAFMDSPIHLDGLHFNVSAPHMHATCLVRSSDMHIQRHLLLEILYLCQTMVLPRIWVRSRVVLSVASRFLK